MIYKLLLLVLFIFLCVRRWRLRRLLKLYNKVKTNFVSLPLVGHAYYFLGDHEVHMNAIMKFGREAIERNDFTAFWLGNYLFLLTADPVSTETLCKVYLEKGETMRFIRFSTGNGSIFAPVSIWKPRRKILVPTFSNKNLNHFVQIFARQSSKMVQNLKRTMGKGPFSLWPFITTYSMDAVCETTVGVTVDAQDNPKHPFLVAFEETTRLLAKRIVEPWLHNDTIYKLTPSYAKLMGNKKIGYDFIEEIIKTKRQTMKTEKNQPSERLDQAANNGLKTFLELLIESSVSFTNQSYTNLELVEEILVLVMAGNDTSAVGAAFTVLMLAQHPDVQEKVFRELQEVFGDSSRPVTSDDLPHLKYLDAVVKETLRLYSPVPVIVRRADKDFTLPNGLKIVEGCEIIINIWAIHRNPRYWGDDAEEFRPERFIDTLLKHPAQFVPFSYGPRNCVGYQYAMMSMKTALATLLRSYIVLPDSTETNKTATYALPNKAQSCSNYEVKSDKGNEEEPKVSSEQVVNNYIMNTKGQNGFSKTYTNGRIEFKEPFVNTNVNVKETGLTTNDAECSEIELNNVIENQVKDTEASKNTAKMQSVTSRNKQAKPLRVKFSLMSKHVDNFTIKLKERKM